ncbi:hypothetical protein JOL79_11540 [Microbispora sp. RL4-1S]|uniref:Uncharacterized protein n=1 Tax=Microbispora oryzae TaxID=2806554 RepID=A0A940WI83_9ACTN|nr:hypothetical protein [Microbispora oryzae]MBP2704447.1 hypothetical protein [Microbispora oryzae]
MNRGLLAYLARFWAAHRHTAGAAAGRMLREHQATHDALAGPDKPDPDDEAPAEPSTSPPSTRTGPAPTASAPDAAPAAGWRGPRPVAEPDEDIPAAPPLGADERPPCRADGLSETQVLALLAEAIDELGSPLAAARHLFITPRED